MLKFSQQFLTVTFHPPIEWRLIVPYRIHPSDRHSVIIKLAELLRQIPDEQFSELLYDAQQLHHYAEFGHVGLVRNSNLDDPYWYEHYLIKDADRLLVEGKPLQACMYCLEEHNHGHSGFVDQVRRVYHRPTNDTERQISEELREMILKVARALIESNPPSLETGIFGYGWMSMSSICTCIYLLGADVPQELIEQFAKLLDEYRAADPSNREVEPLKYAFRKRFGL